MRELPRGQWIEIGFWTFFTVSAFALTFGFDRKVDMYLFGAAGWPRVIIAVVFFAALGQILQSLFKKDDPNEKGATDVVSEESHEALRPSMWLMLGVPLLYALTVESLGFYFTTPFFLFSYLYLTGERRWKFLISVPLGIYLFLSILFTKYLYVGLPTGNLPGFYDFGSKIVEILQ
jgi:hypothetical protein